MTKKQFKTSDNKGRESVWEWEETPEVNEAVKKLHQTPQTVQPDLEDLSEGKGRAVVDTTPSSVNTDEDEEDALSYFAKLAEN